MQISHTFKFPFYGNEFSGIEENYYHFSSKKFQFCKLDDSPDQFVFPLFPSENLHQDIIATLSRKLIYAVPVSHNLNKNVDSKHIITALLPAIQKIECISGSCVIVFFSGKEFTLIVKRINDILFINQYKFENAVEVLYIINSIFTDMQLDQTSDRIVLGGMIASDSQIFKILKTYFDKTSVSELL